MGLGIGLRVLSIGAAVYRAVAPAGRAAGRATTQLAKETGKEAAREVGREAGQAGVDVVRDAHRSIVDARSQGTQRLTQPQSPPPAWPDLTPGGL